MSFESAAPTTDEFSILDLFGPDASQQAQLLVQEAADRSMDEMAEVINAAMARDGDHGTEVNTLLAEKIKYVPHSVIGNSHTPRYLSGHKVYTRLNDPIVSYESLINMSKFNWAKSVPLNNLLEGTTEKLQYWIKARKQEDGYNNLDRDAINHVLRTWGALQPHSTNDDIAAKESLLSQLAHKLTLAMAEGVDLANVSIVLNSQNPTTKRIESVIIHAENDDNDHRPDSEPHDLEWMLRPSTILRRE